MRQNLEYGRQFPKSEKSSQNDENLVTTSNDEGYHNVYDNETLPQKARYQQNNDYSKNKPYTTLLTFVAIFVTCVLIERTIYYFHNQKVYIIFRILDIIRIISLLLIPIAIINKTKYQQNNDYSKNKPYTILLTFVAIFVTCVLIEQTIQYNIHYNQKVYIIFYILDIIGTSSLLLIPKAIINLKWKIKILFLLLPFVVIYVYSDILRLINP